MAGTNTISIRLGNITSTLSINDTSLIVKKQETKDEIPLRNILRANLDREARTLMISYVGRKQRKKPLELMALAGTMDETGVAQVEEWAEMVTEAAYHGVKRSRKIMVLVNPHGGKGQGATIFAQTIHPIFKVAGTSLEIIHTTHKGHAYDIVKALSLDIDAVITVSGDGLIHEVLNGFAHHPDPIRAFATAVAPIPTGSGNGLSLNLLGIEDGFDVVAATLNAIKGQPMRVDLLSVTQGGNRSISFMSQALGMMAELDLGTEYLRWMGDSRFMLGVLRGLITYKACPIQLHLKIAEDDKDKMAELVHARQQERLKLSLPSSSSAALSDYSALDTLPPLKHTAEDDDGWTTLDDSLLFVYAGKGPYVGRDLMAFPVSLPDDGLIDILALPNHSRKHFIETMDGAEKGHAYWHPKAYYMKVHAYRVKPLQKKGHLAVDGEPFPFEEFQVEVHQGLGNFLSPYGHYVAPFKPRNLASDPLPDHVPSSKLCC